MNVAPGGWRYAIVPLLAAPFALIYSATLGLVTLAVGAGILAFFRDPNRTPPPTGVVSPADGKVSVLRDEGGRIRMGVFMNVHNVHVVRSPCDGTVYEVEHSPGGYKPAFSKDSDLNEKLHVRFETDAVDDAFEEGYDNSPSTDGATVESEFEAESKADSEAKSKAESDAVFEAESDAVFEADPKDFGFDGHLEVTFIAGAFARRIYPYVDTGDQIERGERIGHIAFGSRVDVLFPPEVARHDVVVELGDRLRAGETTILETGRNLEVGDSIIENDSTDSEFLEDDDATGSIG